MPAPEVTLGDPPLPPPPPTDCAWIAGDSSPDVASEPPAETDTAPPAPPSEPNPPTEPDTP